MLCYATEHCHSPNMQSVINSFFWLFFPNIILTFPPNCQIHKFFCVFQTSGYPEFDRSSNSVHTYKQVLMQSHLTKQQTHRHRRYALGGQLVEVAAAFIAPDYNAVHTDKLAAHPPLSATTRLRTQQRKVTRIVDLNRTTQHQLHSIYRNL